MILVKYLPDLRNWRTYVYIWVSFGAFSGALYSGLMKFDSMIREPSYSAANTSEAAIRGVYQCSRIAFHSGWGAALGGIAALTAPVSMPIYAFWLESNK